MARVINQNNEVIARKNENEKKVKEKRERKPVSTASILIGLVLIVSAIAIIVVLILYFNQKDPKKPEHIPTALEQYVDNYNGENKTASKRQIVFDAQVNVEQVTYEEYYVLLYDDSYRDNNEVSSRTYEQWSLFDDAVISFCNRLIESGNDLRLFIVKQAENAEEPKINLNGITEFQTVSPMLIHVDKNSLEEKYEDDYEIITGRDKDTVDRMTVKINSVIFVKDED